MGSLLNPSGDSGMGSGGLPNSRYLGGGPGPSSNSSHYSSSLLNSSQPSNKFNTIHSSVNKGGNLFPMNHYETAGAPSGLGTRLGQKDHTYGRLGGGSGLVGRSRREKTRLPDVRWKVLEINAIYCS